MTSLRHTHLLTWLEHAYTHCQWGSREWCNSYLENAKSEIEAQDLRIKELEDVMKWVAYGDERKLGEIVSRARGVV